MIYRLWLSVVLATLALAGCSGIPSKSGGGYPSPDGVWSGTLPKHGSDSDAIELRISIEGDLARVWTVHEGGWMEVMPGAFHVRRHLSNAVVDAVATGQDDDGTWVESWVLVVTPTTPDKLLVTWSRVVNNIDLKEESGKFSDQAAGTLGRLPSGR